jgi:iron-sulfur cluster assembly accessory protein
MMSVVNITEAAKTHIKRVLSEMNKPYLVFGLKGGGCAGFEYFWEPADQELYEQNGTPDRDEFIDIGEGKQLVVDCTSLVYTLGCTIDYKQDFVSSQLVVENPNSKGGCGCGTSVAF